MKILVVGATGMLGQPVARRLRADGFDVRLLVRHTPTARRIFGDDFHLVGGDVTRPATLIPAMAQCDAVYVNLRGGNTVASYDSVERGGGREYRGCCCPLRCRPARLRQRGRHWRVRYEVAAIRRQGRGG